MFVLLVTNFSLFDSFLVFFLEHFQQKHVSSFILNQYLIAFFIFQFQKVDSYLQIIKGVYFFAQKTQLGCLLFFIFFVFGKDKKPLFCCQLISQYAILQRKFRNSESFWNTKMIKTDKFGKRKCYKFIFLCFSSF